MSIRGLDSYSDLEEMTAIRKSRLQDLMSNPEARILQDEIQSIAQALFVPSEWLSAVDDASESIAASDKNWSWALPVMRPIDNSAPNSTDHIDVFSTWQDELRSAWNQYINRHRADEQDRAISDMLDRPTPDGCVWPRFHRSIVIDSVFSLSAAQQYALSRTLCLKYTPSYDEIQDRSRNPKRDFLPSQVFTHEWPIKPDSGTYKRLINDLQKTRDGRLTGNPVDHDLFPHLVIDQIVYVMKDLFRHRFPDDEELTLLEAVRAYRKFLRIAYISDEDQMKFNPDRGHEIWELWDRLPRERVLSREFLTKSYIMAGFQPDDLMAHVNDHERKGRIKTHRRSSNFWIIVLRD